MSKKRIVFALLSLCLSISACVDSQVAPAGIGDDHEWSDNHIDTDDQNGIDNNNTNSNAIGGELPDLVWNNFNNNAATPNDDVHDEPPVPVGNEPLVGRTGRTSNDAVSDEEEHVEEPDENLLAKRSTEHIAPSPSQYGIPRWKFVWGDEFNGPQPGDDPQCYSRHPQCIDRVGWGASDCPIDAATTSQLADLNKCNWSLYAFHNYMNGDESDGNGTNAFDPREVAVRDGNLVLTASANPNKPYDCGRVLDDGKVSKHCPFLSGGVETRMLGDGSGEIREGIVPGFAQKYGRFEAKAKLSHGPGSWPAIWLLHQDWDYGWPYDGEIDMMEQWAGNPDRVKAAYHGGDTTAMAKYVDDHRWYARNKKAYPQSGRRHTFYQNYHIYAVEWDDEELRFYVDKWLIGVTHRDKVLSGKEGAFPATLPMYPFFWILNLTVAPTAGNWWTRIWNDLVPDPDDFEKQTLLIDYVRTYEQCLPGDIDVCPYGGYYDETGGCMVYEAAQGSNPFVWDGNIYLKGYGDSDDKCPYGGRFDGANCIVESYPAEAGIVLRDHKFYTQSQCVENTISPSCPNPCDGHGVFTGYGCVVDSVPKSNYRADIDDGVFYYRLKHFTNIFRNITCEPGHPSYRGNKGCEIGRVPEGRKGFVVNKGDYGRFYLEPVCNVLGDIKNCSDDQSCDLLPYRDATGL